MNSFEQWQNSEFLVFWNGKQKAYHIESVEEHRRKPPMGDGWKLITRTNGFTAAWEMVEQRSKEWADR